MHGKKKIVYAKHETPDTLCEACHIYARKHVCTYNRVFLVDLAGQSCEWLSCGQLVTFGFFILISFSNKSTATKIYHSFRPLDRIN